MELPFEKAKRKVIARREADTSKDYGCRPEERSIEALLKYGIVNLNKPSGPTSHQISDYVKRILHVEKAGHSGTLDPGVSGVLPIAIENATKIVQVLLTAGKEYVTIIHLHSEISEEKIREALKELTGKIMQMPPIRSSVKRQLREREIYYIDVLEISGRDILLKIGCQAGTYIRKLCLHPQTEILSKDAVVSAEYFYKNPIGVYSVYNGKIIKKKPSAVQKIISPKKLLKITMSSGIHFTVTLDHELLRSSIEKYEMTAAKNLKVGDYLVKSLKLPNLEKKYVLADFLDDKFLIAQPEIKQECKKAFIKKYGSIRAMHRAIKLDRKAFLSKSNHAITIKHLKLAGIYDKVKHRINTFKTEKGTIIKLSKLTADFFYLLGLIASDGNNTRENKTIRYTRLKFHNTDEALIDIFNTKYLELFPQIPISKKKLRNNLSYKKLRNNLPYEKLRNNLPYIFQLDTSNSFFATIAASLGVKSPQKFSDIKPILYFQPEFIRAFLKGYFDGDGGCYFKKKQKKEGHYSNIRLYSISYLSIKRLHQMLLKLEIPNKMVKAQHLYAIEVNSLAAKHKFIREIGANSLHKRLILDKIYDINNKSEVCDSLYLGLHYKKIISEHKKKLHKMGGNLSRILNSNIPITRNFYKKCSDIVKLPKLDPFIIEKIISMEYINGSDYVYDMTVPKTHNFLIETGFVSSNCHDIGEKIGCGAHMAELVRTKAGPFNYKDWVTLQDLKDAYETKDEKELRRIIHPIEKGADHLGKIWIIDTAVDTVAHGAALSVPGVAKLHDSINQGDTVAIMTLKDELVAIGEAQMNCQNMHAQKKGIAVTKLRVFMQAGVYPKFVRKDI